MPIRSFSMGVEAALPVIKDGYRVLVHCRAGVHRSVAMACCVLIGMGYSAEAAMKLVKEKRAVADPYVWYIRNRILKFEKQWLAEKRP
jgi:protein-tyrosine phosphatase